MTDAEELKADLAQWSLKAQRENLIGSAAEAYHEKNAWELSTVIVDHLIETVRAEERNSAYRTCLNRRDSLKDGVYNAGCYDCAYAILAAGGPDK